MSVRFAPSPTGRFHIGNLRTAWISHSIARRWGVPWVVRFEDIDRPRVVSGAQAQQTAEMKKLGLIADEVHLQSEEHELHLDLFLRALTEGQVYPCFCSRKEVRENVEGAASAPHGNPLGGLVAAPIYSGKCRNLALPFRVPAGAPLSAIAWRFRESDATGAGDFVIARTLADWDLRGRPASKSFTPAYHWACAIDDYLGHYECLVRAADLEVALKEQRVIQSWLARHRGEAEFHNSVFHTALLVQEDGHRLEKRTRGVTLDDLISAGWTVERLLALFEKSFDPEQVKRASTDASRGTIGAAWTVSSEKRRIMKLSELGIILP